MLLYNLISYKFITKKGYAIKAEFFWFFSLLLIESFKDDLLFLMGDKVEDIWSLKFLETDKWSATMITMAFFSIF